MLKHMAVPLAFLILFAYGSFSAERAHSAAIQPMAYSDVTTADYNVYLNFWDRMYVPASPAVIVTDEGMYYRPPFTEKRYESVKEKQEPVYNHIPDLTNPVVTGKTTIGVMPHGYLEYNEYSASQTKQPIRDFRTELWQNEYNTASLNESYEHSSVEFDSND